VKFFSSGQASEIICQISDLVSGKLCNQVKFQSFIFMEQLPGFSPKFNFGGSAWPDPLSQE